MPRNIYEGIAVSFNFVFMALSVLIALCGFRWLRADRKAVRRALAETPRADCVGTLVVVSGKSPYLSKGMAIDLPREGTVGRSRACDVRLVHQDIPARAARVSLEPGGMLFSPARWESITVNGQPYDKPVLVCTGSRVQWGGLTLRLMLDESVSEEMGSAAIDGVEVARPPVRRVKRVLPQPSKITAEEEKPQRPKKALRTLKPVFTPLELDAGPRGARGSAAKPAQVDIPLGVDRRG